MAKIGKEILECYEREREDWQGHLFASEKLYNELHSFIGYLPPGMIEYMMYVVQDAANNVISLESVEVDTYLYERINGYLGQCEWFQQRMTYIAHLECRADIHREVLQLLVEMEDDITETKAQIAELERLIGELNG